MDKGWFVIPGVQEGYRTLEQQLLGLGPLLEHVRAHRSRVCELGCAEGLILKALREAGAREVGGVEANVQYAKVGNQLLGGPFIRRADLRADFDWPLDADVVLMLAVLHKLEDPLPVLIRTVQHEPGLIVIRLPKETGPVIAYKHDRSRRLDARDVLATWGYQLVRVTEGHNSEWCGYFEQS